MKWDSAGLCSGVWWIVAIVGITVGGLGALLHAKYWPGVAVLMAEGSVIAGWAQAKRRNTPESQSFDAVVPERVQTPGSARKALFYLPGVPKGLNPQSRAPWQVNAREKEEWQAAMGWVIKAAKRRTWDGQPFEYAVVTAIFHWPTRGRHDPDNAAAACKAINDALVEQGVLIDDDFDHIDLVLRQGTPVAKPGQVEVLVEERPR